jgi:hypothetical protein
MRERVLLWVISSLKRDEIVRKVQELLENEGFTVEFVLDEEEEE